MKLSCISLVICLAISGCGLIADQHYQDTLDSMKGRPINDVVAMLGQPTSSSPSHYGWLYHEEIYHPGYWENVPRTVNVYDRHGSVAGTRTYYENVYRQPYTETRHCNTTVYIDGRGHVKDFIFKGNYCGEWFEGIAGE